MKYKQIKEIIKQLAQSQGFYGRLLRQLDELEKNDPMNFNKIVEELERQNFQKPVDIIFYFEC